MTESQVTPAAFIIRVHPEGGGLRGQVVAVDSGAARLFQDLDEAVAFIRATLASTPAGGESPPGRSAEEA